MISPTSKLPNIDKHLTEMFKVHRKKAILDEVCVRKPIGCGQPITKFNDEISAKEYSISGLCQQCQDEVFKEIEAGMDAEEDTCDHLNEVTGYPIDYEAKYWSELEDEHHRQGGNGFTHGVTPPENPWGTGGDE